MKVNDPNLTGVTPGQIGGAGLDQAQRTEVVGRRRPGGPGAAAGDSPDTVSLSGLSSEVRALNVDSPERLARLEKLSAEVAAGRYQADAQGVSKRLVDEALKLKP
jgi:anti-sigma28 factor (negative regulator of flagellin synthesis)